MRRLLASLGVSVVLLAPACSDVEESEPTSPAANGGPVTAPFQEVVDQGATKYFGKAAVKEQAVDEAGVTTYTFDPESGPMCLKGGEFRASVRDTGSEGLFIFLQGGGACWSTFCLAINEAQEGIPTKLDVLNPKMADNPLKDWSTVYLPYCDGSLFVGDADRDDDGDGKFERRQHGLANLSAGLDVAEKRFPHPKRVVLGGSSGGGYGTILATLLVRAKFPSAEILVIDDAGVGLGKPGEPAFLDQILDEWNARWLLPASCPDCTANGHVTPLVAWQLERDPRLKIGVFSSYEDLVISDVFLDIGAEAFHSALLSESGAVHDRFPDRYRRFFIAGRMHTTLLGGIEGLVGSDIGAVTLPPDAISTLGEIELGGIDTTQVRGVTIASWMAAMLAGTPAWDDRLE
jgi:hypothetical protein